MVKKWIEITNEEMLKHYKQWQKFYGRNNLKDYFFFITYAVPEDWKVKEGIVYRKLQLWSEARP